MNIVSINQKTEQQKKELIKAMHESLDAMIAQCGDFREILVVTLNEDGTSGVAHSGMADFYAMIGAVTMALDDLKQLAYEEG